METKTNGSPVNIEEIMDEIRITVRAHGDYDTLPDFSETPLLTADSSAPVVLSASASDISRRIAAQLGDCTVPWVAPVTGKNALIRLYKRIAGKAARCAVAPVAQRTTDLNVVFRNCLTELAMQVDEQRDQIARLSARSEQKEDNPA